MDYKPLLEELLAAMKMSKKKFAESIGASQGNVSGWFNRPNVRPSIDALKRISEVHNVNLNWLITGKGQMFQELQQIDASFLDDTITLPIVGEIAAGEPAEMVYEQPWDTIHIPKGLLYFPPPYLVFRVSGHSMEPHVLPGDLVICSQDWRNIEINGAIMAFRSSDGITLKKLVENYSKKITLLMPLNSHYEPKLYEEGDEDIVMIGILDLCIRRYNRGI